MRSAVLLPHGPHPQPRHQRPRVRSQVLRRLLIFSKLLTPLFSSVLNKKTIEHTYISLTAVTWQLAEYLQAKRYLATDKSQLRMDEPITAVQLAVLAQNKAYELTAREMGQRVFIRGGPAGDVRDELDGLDAAARIRFLAGNRRWLYFEVRNTIKHRAQKMVCILVAERMLAEIAEGKGGDKEDKELLELTRDAFMY